MLTPEQIERLTQRYPNLRIHPTCMLVDCILAENVTLESGVEIRGAIIGPGASIGANATIHNARIPPGAHVAPDTRLLHPENPALREQILEQLPLHLVHKHWLAIRGDETLRVDYDLQAGGTVLDIGGYLGDWAQAILDRHPVQIHIFEPVQSFQDKIRRRLQPHLTTGRATLHLFGLAGHTRTEQITLAHEASSTLNEKLQPDAPTETIQLRAAAQILQTLPPEIALMKINIEGAEYELLDHLLTENLIPRIHHLQIQFHNFVHDAQNRRHRIREALSRTHTCRYNYPFIWEGWTRDSL